MCSSLLVMSDCLISQLEFNSKVKNLKKKQHINVKNLFKKTPKTW